MNETLLEQFRQNLLAIRSEVEAQLASSREGAGRVELDQSAMGRLSRMDAIQVQKLAEEVVRRQKRQLQKIDGALRRIQMNAFGTCFVCEQEIDARRLTADPTITRCVNCVESPSE